MAPFRTALPRRWLGRKPGQAAGRSLPFLAASCQKSRSWLVLEHLTSLSWPNRPHCPQSCWNRGLRGDSGPTPTPTKHLAHGVPSLGSLGQPRCCGCPAHAWPWGCFEAEALKGEPGRGSTRKAPNERTGRLGWLSRDVSSQQRGSSPCHGVVHRRGLLTPHPTGLAARCNACSSAEPVGVPAAPRGIQGQPTWVWALPTTLWSGTRVLRPAPSPRADAGGEGRAGMRASPWHFSSASRSHVGPKVPGLDFIPLHLGSPTCTKGCRFPELGQAWMAGTRRVGGRCQRQRNAASCDFAVPACRVLLRATLGTPSTAARRGWGGGGSQALGLSRSHLRTRVLIGWGVRREWEGASFAGCTPRHPQLLPGSCPGRSTRTGSPSRGCPFCQWLCFVP